MCVMFDPRLVSGVNGSRPVKYPEDMKMSEDEDEGHEEAEDLAAPSLETGPGVPESPESPELSANPLNGQTHRYTHAQKNTTRHNTR